MQRVKFVEKMGYGFGDMASSMFWKLFSYYLPFFFSNVFGLRLDQVALLLMISRIWDAISDPMMGVLADRTETKWGKYRPYLILMLLPFALCGIMLFTTPSAGPTFKLIWAYVSYILMMTVYTGINVPYGAMLGVMTDSSKTKTSLGSFRMFFAYCGSFLVLLLWEPLASLFGGYHSPQGWQHAMMIVSLVAILFFLLCFFLTKERVRSKSTVSILKDLKFLAQNGPWWILIVAALCFNFFCTIRGSAAAYFFNDVIGRQTRLYFGPFSFVFYAGFFLSIGEVANMLGVTLAAPLASLLGKKSTWMSAFICLIVLSIAFYYIPINSNGFFLMIIFQLLISMLTGIVSPLIWSMYADVSDYAENRFGTASTALIFSSSSMAQKFGSAFGGSAVMAILAIFHYNNQIGAMQIPLAIEGIKALMSWIPAVVAFVAVLVIFAYPLTSKRMRAIQSSLALSRSSSVKVHADASSESTSSALRQAQGPCSGASTSSATAATGWRLFRGYPCAMRIAFAILCLLILGQIVIAILL